MNEYVGFVPRQGHPKSDGHVGWFSLQNSLLISHYHRRDHHHQLFCGHFRCVALLVSVARSGAALCRPKSAKRALDVVHLVSCFANR